MHALGQAIHPLYQALAALLAFWYGLVPSYAAAIALLTVTVMVVLAPLTVKSTRSMLAMQRLQPEVKRIQAKYKGDRQTQQEELTALFKENGVSPAGGCLPMFLQLPVFFILYQVIQGLTAVDKVTHAATPKYLSHSSALYQHLLAAHGHMYSLGLDLARSATSVGGGFLSALPFYAMVAGAIALQYIQMRQLTARNPQAAAANPQMQKVQKFTPIIFGVIYISIPAGVNIYFLVSSLFRIGQQELMYRYDPVLRAHHQANQGKVIDTTERPAPRTAAAPGSASRTPARRTPASSAPASSAPAGGILANLRAARENLRNSAGAGNGNRREAGPGWARPTTNGSSGGSRPNGSGRRAGRPDGSASALGGSALGRDGDGKANGNAAGNRSGDGRGAGSSPRSGSGGGGAAALGGNGNRAGGRAAGRPPGARTASGGGSHPQARQQPKRSRRHR